MEKWLDSLSEDWVSEPRSPQSRSHDVSPALAISSENNNPAQSRIPRYKPRSASNLGGANVATPPKKAHSPGNRKTKQALSDKSSSTLNASRKQELQGISKLQSPLGVRPINRRVASVGSISTLPNGTVQHKPSGYDLANANIGSTPDWKKRIIQGKVASGDQCDLFSPIGLEKIFRPAMVRQKQNNAHRAINKTSRTKECSASPPPNPSHAKDISTRNLYKTNQKDPSRLQGEDLHGTEIDDKRIPENTTVLPDRTVTEKNCIAGDSIGLHSLSGKSSQPSVQRFAGSNSQPVNDKARTPEKPNIDQSATKSGFNRFFHEEGQNQIMEDEDRHEKISPLYVSRHQTIDGRVAYAAIDMSTTQLHDIKHKTRNHPSVPSSRLSDDGINYAEAASPVNSLAPDFEVNDWTSHSLPDDLSMGTDSFVAHGGFVSVRRGGFSNDGSFQRRALSPSSLPPIDTLTLPSPASAHKSKARNGSPQDRLLSSRPREVLLTPRTPPRNQNVDRDGQERTHSSGSPLKLFDNYDTFTNDRLSRRMSKFEENLNEFSDHEASIKERGMSNPNLEHSGEYQIRDKEEKDSAKFRKRSQGRISSFGDGELDDHGFPSYQPRMPSPESDHGRNPGDRIMTDHIAFRFKRESYPTSPCRSYKSDITVGSRPKSISRVSITVHGQDLANDELSGRLVVSSASGEGQSHQLDLRNAQGKRLPRSPIKDPRPKRRRTLQKLDNVNSGIQQAGSATDHKAVSANSAGRKRKDALYDGQSQVADPNILALRTILRPKGLTNTCKGYVSRDFQQENTNENRDLENQSLNVFKEVQDQHGTIDPSTQALAGELATFTLDMVQDIRNGSRKASVNTADFFNEAQQIMRMIRAQGRPSPHQQSLVEEVEPSYHGSFQESALEESTKDEFSRPPSREGASLRRLRGPAQVDARVISHLRKFEERDELEVALPSSAKSIRIKSSNRQMKTESSSKGRNGNEKRIESDPPNLRILQPQPPLGRPKIPSTEDLPSLASDVKGRSIGSQSTSGPSTSRSLQTGSSRGSGSKAIIVPETVSHLLSDHMAGMKLDRERQSWVKHTGKESSGKYHQPSSDTTEDLLGQIPDLSVDEVEEMQRTKDAVASSKKMGARSNGITSHDYVSLSQEVVEKQHKRNNSQDSRPQTAEGAATAAEDYSSVPSKHSRFASGGPTPETRVTSWGDYELPPGSPKTVVMNVEAMPAEEHDEEVEHEISILEGRLSRTPTRSNRREQQPRVVTVAFSSPLVDQTETPCLPNSGPEIWGNGSILDLDDSPIHFDSKLELSAERKHSSRFGRRSKGRSSRRISIGSQSYIARPMSRLDEEDEIAYLQNSKGVRSSSMNVVLSTPLSVQSNSVLPNRSVAVNNTSVGFHLSPLPEFTVHQTDKSFNHDADDLVRRGLLSAHEVDGRFALVTQYLVKQLTDLEPYEPYWDFIRRIDLRSRGLETLYKLDEFCRRIEELDVSQNRLDQLDGAPSSIRALSIRQNSLSNLTAWGHLYNLQYLDVSRNQIQSLKGFYRLIHLRELKADDNQIDSLDGISELDGLISLRMKRNLLTSVDFEGVDL